MLSKKNPFPVKKCIGKEFSEKMEIFFQKTTLGFD